MAIPTTMHATAPITRMIDPAPAKNVSRKGSNASVTKEQGDKISAGMTRSNVKKALTGTGVEMLRMVKPSSAGKEAYALAWINTDGSILVVTFDADTDTVLAAEFRDSLL